MAIAAYLVSRSPRAGDTIIDNVHAMIVAIDDAVDTTPTAVRQRGVTVAKAQGFKLPDNYFDTSVALTAFDAAGDRVIFGALQHQFIA